MWAGVRRSIWTGFAPGGRDLTACAATIAIMHVAALKIRVPANAAMSPDCEAAVADTLYKSTSRIWFWS